MIRRPRKDESVGALLRELPVPEHADDFFDRLGAKLRADDATSGSHASDVIDLSVRRDAPATGKRGYRRIMRSATAPAAAVACFALVVGGGQLARHTVEERRERSEIRQRLLSAQPAGPAATGLRIQFRHSSDGTKVQLYEAVLSPNGDYHVSRQSPALKANYNAATGVRSVFHSPEPLRVPVLRTGVVAPVGRPDRPAQPNVGGLLSHDLAAAVRAIAAEDPSAVTPVTLLGRPAIEHVSTTGGGSYFAMQRLVIDDATGIALVVEQRNSRGAFVRYTYVEAITQTPLDQSVLAPPMPTAPVEAEPNAERTTDLPAVAAAVPYSPLTPRWAPEGYQLANVTFAPTLVDVEAQTNPSSIDIVTLVYRNGFSAFTVTNRRAGAPGSWSDPFLQGEPLVSPGSVERVEDGALEGVDLHVVVSPVLWPHIWAQRGDVVVTIAGDLTRDQLLRVAESMEPYRA